MIKLASALRRAPPSAPYPALRSTPAVSRLAMPRQDLRRAPPARPLPTEGVAMRRVILVSGALAVAALVGAVLFKVLSREGFTFIEWATLAISVALSGWVGFGFVSATAGFLAALPRREAGGCAGGGPADHGPHRDPAADLQRGSRADPGGRAGDRRGSGADGPGRPP